jgi:dihydrofolate reductase
MTKDPIVAEMMNNIPKTVFSRTLKKVEWKNTALVNGDAAEAIAQMMLRRGKEMAMFGSSDLPASPFPANLIDEYRIFVNPVVLGAGKHLFKGIHAKIQFSLVNTYAFHSGSLLLCYHPVGT